MDRNRPRKPLKLYTAALALTSILSGANANLGPGQGPPALLVSTIENSNRHRYSGVRVVEFRQNGTMARHEEWVSRSGRKSRVEFPPSSAFAGQIIVEDKGERRHFFPDKNEVRISGARREDSLDRLMGLLKKRGAQPKFAESVGETISGQKTTLISVSDARGNLIQKLFIEPRTGVVLKRELFDPTGTPIGSFAFTKVDLNPKFDERIFLLEPKGARIVTLADHVAEIARKDGYIAAVLPAASGFRLDAVRTSVLTGEDVLLQVYGTAKERVTLFQFKKIVNLDSMKLRKNGTDDFGYYSWVYRGRTFVIMGGQKTADLTKAAESLTLLSRPARG